MKTTKKVLIIVGIVIAVLAMIVFGIFEYYFGKLGNLGGEWDIGGITDIDMIDPNASDAEAANKQLQDSLAQLEQDSDLYKSNSFNILLLGVDSRHNTLTGNTDSIIVISIDKSNKRITMSSILRDLYVEIPGKGQNKINAAYALGGPQLLTKTIKNNLGIDIDRVVVINFSFAVDFINELGGVDLEVTAREIEIINHYLKELNKLAGRPEGTYYMTADQAGMVHLNGDQALAHSRDRYVGNDVARTGRQRQIIDLCIQKLKGKNLLELNGLLDKFLPRVRTDLSRGDCASLMLMALDIKDFTIDYYVLPVEGTWEDARIGGKAVKIANFAANRKAWYTYIAADTDRNADPSKNN